MRFLQLAFWTILVSIAIRLGFFGLFVGGLDFGQGSSLIHAIRAYDSVLLALHWTTLLYTTVTGFILWLFGEKRWIIRSSYAYLLSIFLYLSFSLSRPKVPLTPMETLLVNLPCLYTCVALALVTAPPIKNLCRLVALFWVGYCASWFWPLRIFIPLYGISLRLDVLPLLLPILGGIPMLSLIRRAKAHMIENKGLHREVLEMSGGM